MLPDWWRGSSQPLVYVSFGTVFGYLQSAATAYKALSRAVVDLPVRVLLTIGRKLDPATLGPLPPNVHVEPWVHQPDALASATLVVCHGGSGTVYGALAAGVPLVVVPAFADQLANGRRIATAGAALTVEADKSNRAHGRLIVERDSARITAAIEVTLGDPAYRAAAHRIGAEMAAVPLIDDVLADVTRG